MISKDFKSQFQAGEPVIQEFAALMKATFRYYAETHGEFFEKFPTHLLQSELVSFINVDLKNRLFKQAFCETIPDALKSLRRVIIRMEDLRRGEPPIPAVVHDLARLTALAERVEALYQLHWEYYKYFSRLNEEELVGFLLEVDNIGKAWDAFTERHGAVRGLVTALQGAPRPENTGVLSVAYQIAPPHHLATTNLTSLIQFLESGYRFVCAVCDIDAALHPMTLLHIEIGDPMELRLGIPEAAEEPLRKMLQYLFLKDLLKRETLLKFVFEAIRREYGSAKPISAAALTAFQKDLAAPLKQLPESGRFQISGRTFPEDSIRVLQEFTGSLEEKKVNFEALLKAADKGKTATRTAPVEPQKPMAQPTLAAPPRTLVPPGEDSAKEKAHIRILTDRA